MNSTSWIVRRAALAIALMVGFYALALAIGLGLLAIPYAAWTVGNVRLPAKLILICVASGLTVLWAIVPRPDRFTAPGPKLDEKSHPDLFRMVRDVASSTQQELPSDVYLLNDVNAWVAHRGGIMGFGSHRVMGVGLPLLQTLTQAELKAIVAHEFGHYASGDVKIGPWIYKTRAAIGRTLKGVHGGWIEAPFKWYGDMFLRLTHDVSRQQEFIADTIAAGVAGAANLMSALQKVTGLAPTFAAYLSTEVAPVLRAGFLPPITVGFDHFRQEERIAALSRQTIEEAQASSVTDEFDTHPCLRDRLAALAPLRDRRASSSDDGVPASAFLPDMEQQATALMQFAIGADTLDKLKPLPWDSVGDRVYAPMWAAAVKMGQHEPRHDRLRRLEVPDAEQRARRRPGGHPYPDQRRDRRDNDISQIDLGTASQLRQQLHPDAERVAGLPHERRHLRGPGGRPPGTEPVRGGQHHDHDGQPGHAARLLDGVRNGRQGHQLQRQRPLERRQRDPRHHADRERPRHV